MYGCSDSMVQPKKPLSFHLTKASYKKREKAEQHKKTLTNWFKNKLTHHISLLQHTQYHKRLILTLIDKHFINTFQTTLCLLFLLLFVKASAAVNDTSTDVVVVVQFQPLFLTILINKMPHDFSFLKTNKKWCVFFATTIVEMIRGKKIWYFLFVSDIQDNKAGNNLIIALLCGSHEAAIKSSKKSLLAFYCRPQKVVY